MFTLTSSLALLATVVTPGTAAVIRSNAAVVRDTCTNADSRLCWDGTYDINTNYYTSGPRTGKVVQYNFEITNTTAAPEGVARQVLIVNGQIPAPTIVADWGDTIQVTLKNSMQYNGTSIHWHGIRQLGNFLNDGVNGITECPLAPGDTKTYTFVAEQYGTTWYHSHYSAQYGDGVWGAIQINGPATAEYDIDLGTVTLTDWFSTLTSFEVASLSELGKRQTPQNFLVNGTNVNFSNTTLGERFKLTFTPGKKHRIRFVNTAVDQFFRVSIDDHPLTVIQTDFNPIVPYTANTVGIAIGQRYDVIVDATETNGTYWLRTWPCGGNSNAGTGTASAYVVYDGSTDVLPTTTSYTNPGTCVDESASNLVPNLLIDIDSSGWSTNETLLPVSTETVAVDGVNVARWTIGGAVPMSVNFSYPTVEQVDNGVSLAAVENAYSIAGGGAETVYWLIQNEVGVAHPIHLHLHDFNVISSGTGTFNASTAVYNWLNPPRRDVATLPASGYLLLAYKADNPGIALMHCHIAWHVAEGLSLQLVERATEIDFSGLSGDWATTCANWKAWDQSSANVYGEKTDSGLRRRSLYSSRVEGNIRRL